MRSPSLGWGLYLVSLAAHATVLMLVRPPSRAPETVRVPVTVDIAIPPPPPLPVVEQKEPLAEMPALRPKIQNKPKAKPAPAPTEPLVTPPPQVSGTTLTSEGVGPTWSVLMGCGPSVADQP